MSRQLLPVHHQADDLTTKAWRTPVGSVKPIDAFWNGVWRVAGPYLAVKASCAEVLALPVRALTGTSFSRREDPAKENFMHRGALGFVGDNLSRGATFFTAAAGVGLGALAGLVMRDTDSARKVSWGQSAAAVGAWIGFVLRLPLEIVGSVTNIALLAGTWALALSFPTPIDNIIGGLLFGAACACGIGSAVARRSRRQALC